MTDQRGTKVTFKPDPLIFETTDVQLRHPLAAPARAGVPEPRRPHHDRRTSATGSRTSSSTRAASCRFVEHLNRAKTPIHHDVIYLQGTRDGVEVEIAMQWNDGYAESVYAFANNINTIEGGTHLIGFKRR